MAPYRPTRAVFALEELHSLEDEVARTSLALTGSPLDLFNDTVPHVEMAKNENKTAKRRRAWMFLDGCV